MHENISPNKFKEKLDQGNAVLLDVRNEEEYVEGKIPGHTLIDFKAPDFQDNIAKLDKDKNYLIYCRSGNRSGQTCQLMAQLGFKGRLYNLEGGIQAWNDAFGKE